MEKNKPSMRISNTGKIIVYCDGGSRGNPGPAAIAFVISKANLEFPEGKQASYGAGRIKNLEFSKAIGIATNNEAEYQAAIFALKKIKQLIGKENCKKIEIEIKSDSELLISQLNGRYKIKEKNLALFFIEIWNLKQDFGEVKFFLIPREENKEADRLVNKELDSQIGMF